MSASQPLPLVIYHGNCADGFAAAWVASKALGECELFVGKYGDPPPLADATGRDVFVVDFSYPRAQTEALHAVASQLVMLDHHLTAQAEIGDLPYAVFDMDRSGAGITWDYFHDGEPRPWIVDYVEDRDLWRFKLPESEAISLRIRLTPYELEAWDALAARELPSIITEARGAVLYLKHYVADALRNLYVIQDVDGRGADAMAVNISYTGVSDVLNAALSSSACPMAIGWFVDVDGNVSCSVRSAKPYDCSVLAKSMGGGGHAQAAGFKLTQDHPFAARLMRRPVGQ